MSLTRRAFLALPMAAGCASCLTGRIDKIDRKKQETAIELVVVPRKTTFWLEGEIENSSPGDIVNFTIEKGDAKIGRQSLPVRKVIWLP